MPNIFSKRDYGRGMTGDCLHASYVERRAVYRDARKMRNIIVHDYVETDIEQVYSTIHNDLPNLKVAFAAIKSEIITTN